MKQEINFFQVYEKMIQCNLLWEDAVFVSHQLIVSPWVKLRAQGKCFLQYKILSYGMK